MGYRSTLDYRLETPGLSSQTQAASIISFSGLPKCCNFLGIMELQNLESRFNISLRKTEDLFCLIHLSSDYLPSQEVGQNLALLGAQILQVRFLRSRCQESLRCKVVYGDPNN